MQHFLLKKKETTLWYKCTFFSSSIWAKENREGVSLGLTDGLLKNPHWDHPHPIILAWASLSWGGSMSNYFAEKAVSSLDLGSWLWEIHGKCRMGSLLGGFQNKPDPYLLNALLF